MFVNTDPEISLFFYKIVFKPDLYPFNTFSIVESSSYTSLININNEPLNKFFPFNFFEI